MPETAPDAPADRPPGRGLLAALSLLTALGVGSTTMVIPSLPDVAVDLHATPARVQLVLSVFLIAYASAQLVWGPLSDRYGRRPTLIAGLTICLAASIACIFAPDIDTLIGLRFVQALGGCSAPVMARAIVRDRYERREAARAMAIINSAFAVTPVLAPLLGAALQEVYGWRGNFTALAAFAAVMLTLALTALAESNPPERRTANSARQIIRTYRSLLTQPVFVGYSGAAAFGYGAFFVFTSMSSFVLIGQAGLSAASYGWVLSAIFMGYGAGSLLSARMSRRLDPDRAIATGSTISIVFATILTAAAVFGGGAGIVVDVSLFVLVCFGIGMVFPNGMAGAVTPFPRIAGAASALAGFLQLLIGTALGTLVLQTMGVGMVPMTVGILADSIAMGCAWFVLARPRGGTVAG